MSRRTREDIVPDGAGDPRLVTIVGGRATLGSPAAEGVTAEFRLGRGTTLIGGARGQDIHLAGLPSAYGAIVHRHGDEYVYIQLEPQHTPLHNGMQVVSASLHHGDELTLGTHHLVFQRDEYADHGRFDGGRQGGEFSGDRLDRY